METTPTQPISASMIIRDVVAQHPGIAAVFTAHGLPCTGCHVATYETIAGGAATHALPVDTLLADLNAFAHSGTVPPPRSGARGRPVAMAPAGPRQMDAAQQPIRHIIAVMSGKGGVGKSLVTALLAVALRRTGAAVGILDGDITGPSIPRMFGIPTRSMKANSAEPPASSSGIKIMSMNVLLDMENEAVVWRGPMVSGAIKQFYTDITWGNLDYLLVDLPPGTSDAPMTVLQSLPVDGVIIVSTPQELSTMVVRKAISMCDKMDAPVIGMVENMSYVDIPGTGQKYELFGPSQGAKLVAYSGAPLLGQLPVDAHLAHLCDTGQVETYQTAPFSQMAANFLVTLRDVARPTIAVR